MAEKEKILQCSSCDSSCVVTYEDDGVDYLLPEICPFCGETITDYDDDDDDWFDDDEDEDLDS